jgi:hypothetical protein
VRERLADALAYTTVLWVLQTLEEKGHVRHEKEGRAYRYYPTTEPETAGEGALDRLVDKVSSTGARPCSWRSWWASAGCRTGRWACPYERIGALEAIRSTR